MPHHRRVRQAGSMLERKGPRPWWRPWPDLPSPKMVQASTAALLSSASGGHGRHRRVRAVEPRQSRVLLLPAMPSAPRPSPIGRSTAATNTAGPAATIAFGNSGTGNTDLPWDTRCLLTGASSQKWPHPFSRQKRPTVLPISECAERVAFWSFWSIVSNWHEGKRCAGWLYPPRLPRFYRIEGAAHPVGEFAGA